MGVFLLLARNIQKHLVSCFWLSTTGAQRNPTPNTPHQELPSISRAAFAYEASSDQQVGCKRSDGSMSFLIW